MSEKSYRKELLVCFGMPVDENPTVIPMNAAFSQLGLDYIYNSCLVTPDNLKSAVNGIRAMGLKGGNCTVPHKVAVMEHLDEIMEDAALIGAVNTMFWKNGKLCGGNTDGKGYIMSMEQASLPIAGKHFVILGAGGAAKAVSVELALHGASAITIVNRTVSKGEELVAKINQHTACKADFVPWSATYSVAPTADFVINCTDIGLYPDPNMPNVDMGSLTPNMVVCDVIPNPPKTRFLQEAQSRGCKTFDGLSMLVNQGIVALELWTGLTADPAPMKAALSKEFGV
ncbi:MAG: shikimate dehydrogenase [Eubacteriales bacterium]